MSDFNNLFATLIMQDDKNAMRKLIDEMKVKLETLSCEDSCKILKKRIRRLEDYLRDEIEDDTEI